MSDIIATGLIRAMVLFHHPSNDPKDRFVNVWHFQLTAGDMTNAFDVVGQALYDFYATPSAGGGAITNRMPGNKIGSWEIRCYDMGQPPPRLPYIMNVDPLPTFGTGSSAMPEEVAITLSFVSGVGPRARGRIYLGPFIQNVCLQDAGKTLVQTDVRAEIVASAEDLMGFSSPMRWVTASRMDQSYAVVVGGWVDDAFDTQRRRGLAPGDRTLFGELPSAGGTTIGPT